MSTSPGSLAALVERSLWPLVERLLATRAMAGVAVAVVHDDDVVARGFGVRDVRTGEPVTPQSLFHLASVSKPVVAEAVVSLATAPVTRGGRALDLDAPVTDWIPELSLADGRQDEVTARRLLSHTSGLGDVSDYGWHDPQLGDDALSDLARSLAGWRLESDPDARFSYSNVGFELLGLLLSRLWRTTFEDAVRRWPLLPLGMERSTFFRAEVPEHLAVSPHVGRPLVVPDDAYPYTRRHAPSSTLHSNVEELCRWMAAHFAPVPGARDDPWTRLDPALVELVSQPVASIGEPPWDEETGLGWALGAFLGERTLGHSGADPGFGSRVVVVPAQRTGVVVLANSNTVPGSAIAAAALELVLTGEAGEHAAALRDLRPPLVDPVAESLASVGAAAARATYDRLTAQEEDDVDPDDDEFADAVWGAIELHRTDLVRPLLGLWTDLRPDSSAAWTMTGWAHQVEGDTVEARRLLERALELDPDNEDAALILSGVPAAGREG
ncbi:MAG: serine hydrolase [Nocardioidaceae bacterium]